MWSTSTWATHPGHREESEHGDSAQTPRRGRGGRRGSDGALMKIGVVGIGKMGTPIAGRLLAAGHEVSICNRSRSASVDSLADRGAVVRASPADLAANAEVILTALPTEDSVRDVYAQMSDVAAAGQLYVDHSTVSINLNRWCADALTAKHAAFLDAPVSGGPAGAEAGTLTVMVGGDEQTFNRALPV